MAIKPPKQFCGKEHWSGETCKECDGIKARKFPEAKPLSVSQVRAASDAPCARCAEYVRNIGALGVEIAGLQEKLREHEGKAERERIATLERVRKYRAAKAETVK